MESEFNIEEAIKKYEGIKELNRQFDEECIKDVQGVKK